MTFERKRQRLSLEHVSRVDCNGRNGSLWLPWLIAPLFLLMPMGGCALAGKLRETAAAAVSRTAVGSVETVVLSDRD